MVQRMIFLQDSKTNFRSFWIQKPLCRYSFGTGWFRRVPQVDGKPKGLQVAIGIAIEKLCLPSVQATFKLFYNILIVSEWKSGEGKWPRQGLGARTGCPRNASVPGLKGSLPQSAWNDVGTSRASHCFIQLLRIFCIYVDQFLVWHKIPSLVYLWYLQMNILKGVSIVDITNKYGW